MKRTYREQLAQLQSAGLLRRLRRQERTGPVRALIDGHDVILFSGNDYLGLSSHPEVIRAASDALREFGGSASSARLISGNHTLYRSLEEDLAHFKEKEAVLVMPSGYTANLALIASIGETERTIFMDRLGHASLYDGWRLSGARLRRFRHNDLDHLEQMLAEENRGSLQSNGGMIVTEGVFSMDGDLAPLAGLANLANRFDCLLVVDDAHGTGVLGADGKGTASHLGVEPDVEVGTLSKAAGSVGGFIAGNRDLIDYLVNRARPFIFSTGLPPASLAAARTSLRLFREEGWRRERVLSLASTARHELRAAGFEIPEGFTPIIPLIVGDEQLAIKLSDLCLERGIFIPSIRTPAVPKNMARLRMTVCAAHATEELSRSIDILTASAAELGIIQDR